MKKRKDRKKNAVIKKIKVEEGKRKKAAQKLMRVIGVKG